MVRRATQGERHGGAAGACGQRDHVYNAGAVVPQGVVKQLDGAVVVVCVGDLGPHKMKLPENTQVLFHKALGPHGPGIHE